MSINYDHKSIQMRRGTSAEWREYGDKCVPLEAEICVELMQYPDGNINKNVGVKVGNGIDTYEELPYVILNEELDPVFTNHPAYQITQEMIDAWSQSSVEPGEEYGQVTRWDGEEWVPSSLILLKDVDGIEVSRKIVPDKASKIDVGTEDLHFRAGYFDNIEVGEINIEGNAHVGGNIDIDGSINIDGNIIGGENGIDINLEIENINEEITNINGEINTINENIGTISDGLEQEISDRQDGDAALGKRIDELVTDDLADVNSAGATKDQFLIHNGSQWIAEDFHIDTELTFKGSISVVSDPAPTANNGDLYINNESGVVGASWTGIDGKQVSEAVAVGWSDTNARWYILGDIASAAVMAVEPGLGIDVDDSKPAEPVVSIDRDEVDKWYEPPISPKRTAFNKNFGTTSGTVAEGDHDHDLDYADINHDHDGVYQPAGTYDNYSHWRFQVSKDGSVSNVTQVASNGLINFESGDGITITRPSNNVIRIDSDGDGYDLPLASNGTRGGVQIGYAANGKNYPVQLSGEKMFVNVPWSNTQGDFDKYEHWNVTVEGASTSQMVSKSTLDFKGSGATTVSKSGNTITISSPAASNTLPDHGINSHTDVDTSGAQNGDLLMWDGSKWVPAKISGGGMSLKPFEHPSDWGEFYWNLGYSCYTHRSTSTDKTFTLTVPAGAKYVFERIFVVPSHKNSGAIPAVTMIPQDFMIDGVKPYSKSGSGQRWSGTDDYSFPGVFEGYGGRLTSSFEVESQLKFRLTSTIYDTNYQIFDVHLFGAFYQA